MADTKLVICEKCLGTGHVNGGNENSTWSKTCEDCHGTGFSRVPMTNADRIRAMSDEELAELLANETYRIAKPCFDTFGYGLEKQVIFAKRIEWLQQPSE